MHLPINDILLPLVFWFQPPVKNEFVTVLVSPILAIFKQPPFEMLYNLSERLIELLGEAHII